MVLVVFEIALPLQLQEAKVFKGAVGEVMRPAGRCGDMEGCRVSSCAVCLSSPQVYRENVHL